MDVLLVAVVLLHFLRFSPGSAFRFLLLSLLFRSSNSAADGGASSSSSSSSSLAYPEAIKSIFNIYCVSSRFYTYRDVAWCCLVLARRSGAWWQQQQQQRGSVGDGEVNAPRANPLGAGGRVRFWRDELRREIRVVVVVRTSRSTRLQSPSRRGYVRGVV